jgi:CheY-like chemotaxis protein
VFSRGTSSAQYRKALPALVLLDLDLPKLNGKEVLRAIRMDTRTKSIPVVILTGSTAPEDLPTSFQADNNLYYIHKPLTAEQLREAISKLGIQGLQAEESQRSNAFLTAAGSQ